MEPNNNNGAPALKENTDLVVFDNYLEIFKGGGNILLTNQNSVARAVADGQKLLELIKEKGMNAETDALLNTYLVKLKKTYDKIGEGRKPITQIMDAVKKLFTQLETQIDPSGKNNIYFSILSYRNQYVQQLAKEKEAREKEEKRKLAQSNERLTIIADAESGLDKFFNQMLYDEQQKLTKIYKALTLDNWDTLSIQIEKFTWSFGRILFNTFQLNGRYIYHDNIAIQTVIAEVLDRKYTGYFDTFTEVMQNSKNENLDVLPSRKTELLEIKAADDERLRLLKEAAANKDKEERERLEREAAEKERQRLALEEEARIRGLEEEARQLEQKKQLDNKADDIAEGNKVISQTANLFESEASLVSTTPEPETRKAWEIEVTNSVGFMEIFRYWFENEGRNLPIDDIEKKTMKQMKTYCENAMTKNSIQIESKFLKYNEQTKAVVRKEKAAK